MEISGVALNEKGDTVAGAHVALISEPRLPFRQRATRTDQNGAYRLANVPPGEYFLVALDSVEPGALEDDEFVKTFRAKMKKVKVESEGSQSATLTVLSADLSR
jgi:hypothetical protein